MAHVVHVADYGNPGPGSFIPALFALARKLRTQNDRCSLISKRVEGATWHASARETLDDFTAVSSCAQLYRSLWRASPDVVHVHFVGWSLPATLVGYLRGVRVIWHLHSAIGDAAAGLRRFARTAKYAWFGGGVYRFVTVSDALRRAISEFGVSQERTAVIRNAVNTGCFRQPSQFERESARERLGIGLRERVLLYFGRDIWIKGADILWQALTGAKGVVLIAVGAPPKALEEFRGRVRTIAVPFVADTAPLYWAADALVMPSRVEGAPYTMLEALCSGVPVIASDVEGLIEIGRHEPSVTLVANTPDALARALGGVTVASAEQIAQTRVRFGLDRWVREVSGLYAA